MRRARLSSWIATRPSSPIPTPAPARTCSRMAKRRSAPTSSRTATSPAARSYGYFSGSEGASTEGGSPRSTVTPVSGEKTSGSAERSASASVSATESDEVIPPHQEVKRSWLRASSDMAMASGRLDSATFGGSSSVFSEPPPLGGSSSPTATENEPSRSSSIPAGRTHSRASVKRTVMGVSSPSVFSMANEERKPSTKPPRDSSSCPPSMSSTMSFSAS